MAITDPSWYKVKLFCCYQTSLCFLIALHIYALQKWLMTQLKRILMVKDTTPSWCVMRECGLEPLHFNWFQAAVRLYNALTQSNSSTARKILHADMQLSSWCDDCWSSHWDYRVAYPVCYGWSHTILLVQGKAADVWAHWSWSLCCGPQGEAPGLLDRKKERLRQQGNPCLRELRKKFTAGASTRQTSTIKLGRRQ